MTKQVSNFWQSIRKNVQLKRQTPSISNFPREGDIPLSLTQEKLYLIEQIKGENSTLNMGGSLQFKNSLNITALEQTLTEIVRRHEILRTTFTLVNQKPIQKISDNFLVKIPIIDLQNLPENERKIEAKKLSKQFKNKPFNLSNDYLWSCQLIKLNQEDYIFTFVTHHLIWDSWSFRIFLQEFNTLYEAFSHNQPSPLPELSIQYADYTQWQRSWLQGDKLSDLENYWKKQFEGDISSLILPIDRPYSSVSSPRGSQEQIILSPSLTKAVKTLANQEGVSLFIILFIAFNLLLNRYSVQENLLICTTVSGRDQNELKKIIGYFNNILVLPTKITENLTFKQLLNQVSENYLHHLEYQNFPFHNLAEIQNLARVSLTRAMFSFINIPGKNQATNNIQRNIFQDSSNRENFADFDIAVSLRESNRQIQGTLSYKSDLFQRETISNFINNFETLLETIINNPDILINELSNFTYNHNSILDYHGNPVNLEQVKTTLNEHSLVEDSLIIISDNPHKDKQLIAYIIPEQKQVPNPTELKQYLQEKLPEYMIPTAYIPLEAFPLTPNGKIDRKALPEPDFELTRENEFIPPRNSTELTLVNIWQQVLKIEKIGLNDNFFELGGHSLSATQIISRIRNNFQIEFPLRYLFQQPTIAQLAELIDNLCWTQLNQISLDSENLEEGEI